MNKITVVFPMAGEGQRFGGKFKPFLRIFDKTFIELAVEPFLKHKDVIDKLIFIIRDDHMQEFQADRKIASFSFPIEQQIMGIAPTSSPLETICTLFHKSDDPIENVIFCDCDHSLNVDDIFSEIVKGEYDCIIPGWEINETEKFRWSIASVFNDNRVHSIREKEYPFGKNFYGVIGCYYFRHFFKPVSGMEYVSEVINWLIGILAWDVKLIPVTEAEFFGDPERLQNIYTKKKATTIFCDIDGTLIKHENIPNYSSGIELLEGAVEKINEWRSNNCFIVLTTSRDEQFKPELTNALRLAGIKYEQLIMGLPPGTRVLINDKKPYSEADMAVAHHVVRDIGVKDLKLGNSLADTQDNGSIMYKMLPEGASEYQVKKFESQYASMRSLSINPGTTHFLPKIYEFHQDNSYGMERLVGYTELHKLNDKSEALGMLAIFLRVLYSIKINTPKEWLQSYLNEKIYAKEQALIDLGLDPSVVFGKLRSMDGNTIKEMSPKFLCHTFHGDLTYENILVREPLFPIGEDYYHALKLIDFDNDNKPGAAEMDLGKLFQSALAQYEHWEEEGEPHKSEVECNKIVAMYMHILQESDQQVFNKAKFYCALHLFRMIPYQAVRDINRAKKALELCQEYLGVKNEFVMERVLVKEDTNFDEFYKATRSEIEYIPHTEGGIIPMSEAKKLWDESNPIKKIEHFYEPITGWFTFSRFYKDMVARFSDGSKFVEVGVYEGKSFAYLMVEMINAGKTFEVTAVDSFTFEDEKTKENILTVFKRNMLPVDGRYKIINGQSNESAGFFEDGSLDLVFLDADHVYERIKSDILAWLPKLTKGGILAGHDFQPEHPGVIQAVNEIFGEEGFNKEYLDEWVWYVVI